MVSAIRVRFDRVADTHFYRNAEWLSKMGYHRSGDNWDDRFDAYVPVHTQNTLTGRKPIQNWVRAAIADAVTEGHPQFVVVYVLEGLLRAKVIQNTAVVDNSVITVTTSGDLHELADAINDSKIPAPKSMTIKAVLPLIENL